MVLNTFRQVRISTSGNADNFQVDPVIYVRRECDEAGSEVICNDDANDGLFSEVFIERADPGIYYIFADNFGRQGARYTVSIEVSDIEPDCREDRDCPGVSVCRDAFCVDPDCIRDDQCADSERCLNGRCEIREDFCARDTDCANPSQICEDETCVSTNGACADRDDCPDESYCIAGGV